MHMSRLTRGAGAIIGGGLFAGLLGGVALGNFATGRIHGGPPALMFADRVGNPHAAYDDDPADDTAYSNYDILGGPPMTQVVCKGCGPGINDRMRQSYAFGYDDHVVQAYLDYRPLPPLTAEALEADVASTPSPAPPPAPGQSAQPVAPPADPSTLLPADRTG